MPARLFIGNLPAGISKEEVEELFAGSGKIKALNVKEAREPGQPSFAFCEYEDERDGEVAISKLDGYEIRGVRMRVEASRGGRVAAVTSGPPRRSNFRARLVGLPAGCSWQDLKDNVRRLISAEAGFAEVLREQVDGASIGIVEVPTGEDLDRLLAALNNGAEIRVRDASGTVVRAEVDTADASQYQASSMPQRDRGYGGPRGGYDDRDRGYSGYGRSGGYDDRRGGGGGYGGGYPPRDDRGYNSGYPSGGGYRDERYAGGYAPRDDRGSYGGGGYSSGGGRGGYDSYDRGRSGGGYGDRPRSRSRDRGGYGGYDDRRR